MAMFDPKKAREQGGDRGIPAGEYLLAMKRSEHKISKNDNPYRHCMFVVIAGPAKERTFFDNISCDLTNAGAMARLSILAEQCGVEEAFDLEVDADFAKHFHGRPFKARVSRKINGNYVDNGIERFLIGKDVTEQDKRTMQEWVTEQADAEEWSGSSSGPDDAPPPDDDDDFGGRATRGGGIDDDIPF